MNDYKISVLIVSLFPPPPPHPSIPPPSPSTPIQESPIGNSATPSVTLPPPLDSPPPVPPNYPPPTISPADLGIGTIGPTPVAIRDTSPVPNQHYLSHDTPRNTPRAVSSSLTPKVTINKPTPESTDLDTTYHSFRIDSFDDYDDEVSVV